MASRLRDQQMPIASFCEYFGISEETEFVELGVAKCCDLFLVAFSSGAAESHSYFVGELLQWRRLAPGSYKRYIGEAVLSRAFTESERFNQALLANILDDPRLGDPRLRSNSANWAPVDPAVRERVLNALSKADIVFFFDNVMTNAVDRHGRKKFWLKYLSKLRQSRPLLTDTDRQRLASKMHRERSLTLHYGRKSGQHSAFILDFGDVLVVEFNEIGACYIYQRHKSRLFPDIYRDAIFTDSELKQRPFAEDWLTHQGSWEWKFASALAQYGIRP